MAPVLTTQAEQAAIMGYLAEKWEVSEVLRTPIAWPNAAYTPTGEPYIQPVVNRQEAFNVGFSATDKQVRHPGLLTINVRTPVNQGDGEALELADTAAALFRNIRIESLHFRAPTVREVGREGAWYWVQVDCPYWRDAILTDGGDYDG